MENSDDSQYCDECGGPLSVVTQTRKSETLPQRPVEGGTAMRNDSRMEAVAGSELAAKAPASTFASSTNSAFVSAPHAKLIISRGHSAGKEFPLHEDETYIGRWDADGGIFPDVDLDVHDPEAKVSRRHARISRRSTGYYIVDLGSTNGTFINRGRRLLPGDPQPLHDGDEIIIGKTFLRFYVLK